MVGTKVLLSLYGYETYMESPVLIRMVDGSAVQLVYKCLGYGVTSFWLAFVFANDGRRTRKLGWMLGGAMLLWVINVIRISLVLLATSKHWAIPLGWDHHTWFNIAAYGMIFLMIWLYDKRQPPSPLKVKPPPPPKGGTA